MHVAMRSDFGTIVGNGAAVLTKVINFLQANVQEHK
jgi:hypothetical protein